MILRTAFKNRLNVVYNNKASEYKSSVRQTYSVYSVVMYTFGKCSVLACGVNTVYYNHYIVSVKGVRVPTMCHEQLRIRD